MPIALNPLPYAADALEPVISKRTLEFHHNKHHAGYVAKLNDLIAGSALEKAELTSIVRASAKHAKQKTTYNNAAQVWNHDFYWQSMAPNAGGSPPPALEERIQSTFQSMENFLRRFVEVSMGQFGSGWSWLVVHNGQLEIMATHDADSPLTSEAQPLFVCDLWEHAYYLDYQNRRADYVKATLEKLIDWQRVAERLVEADHRSANERRRAHA